MRYMKLLKIMFFALIVVFAVLYVRSNWGSFRNLEFEEPYLILFLIPLFLVNYFLTSLVNLELLKGLGVKLKKSETFGLSIITGFYNLITPFHGGAAARAVYLKKRHDFSYMKFLVSLSAVYVLIFFIASLFGLLASSLYFYRSGSFNLIILLIFVIPFVFFGGIIAFSPKVKASKNHKLNKIIDLINSWHSLKSNRRIIFLVSLYTIVQMFISALSLYFQFRIFGYDLSLFRAVMLVNISYLSIVLSLTPGNLGVSEIITVLSASGVQIPATYSLSSALLGRAVSSIVLFILGPIFSYRLIKKNQS